VKDPIFFAENSIRELPEYAVVAKRFPELKWIEDYQAFRLSSVQKEKQCVIFARKRGSWIKPFHCYDSKSGFRYLSLDLAEGCSFDCVYCYLQSYLNHGALVLFLDFETLFDEINSLADGNLWISTGLLTDSLLAENRWPFVGQISQRIPEHSILELRTKTSDLSALKAGTIVRDRVVISWSMNPETVVRNFEYQTSGLQERLQGARQAIAMGYRVAFHLDPVFYYDGWQTEYSGLMKQLQQFPIDRIAFVSLGLFRYMPDLGAVIRKRFPFHPILTGEFFGDSDGKYHYLRAIRTEMYEKFSKWMDPWVGTVPIFRSMEPDARL
jgi:spore photoproduct lyase